MEAVWALASGLEMAQPSPKSKTMKSTFLQQTALLAGFVAAGYLSAYWRHGQAQTGPSQVVQDQAFDFAEGLSQTFVESSARAADSVVMVRSFSRSTRNPRRLRPLQEGSGVIVRPDGVFVTNHHVVKGGVDFSVVTRDGVRRKARLLASDRDADLAVLRISKQADEPAFQALSLDGPPAQVGQIVMALGNPLGLGHTVTSGIVSGLGRSDLDIAVYEDFIQTDCVVNPGSSGGPLINLKGDVVGITIAVGLKSNGDDGIAFAIPASMVRKVVDDVLEHGRVIRGWIGIRPYYRFDPEWEKGFQGVSQVKIQGFTESGPSPAKEAGLQVGDIVVALGDRRLLTLRDLTTAVAECAPNQIVEVEVWRKGQTLRLPVKLAERSQEP